MKTIPFATRYKVTRDGRVFNETKELKPVLMSCGYKRLRLICDWDGKPRGFLVHRLVAMTYLPNPENKPQVNHINGIKLDNRVENLEWVTAGENQKHAYLLGLKTIPAGEFNPRTIVTEAQVIEIYYKLLNGARVCDISKEYGLAKTSVSSIKSKNNWGYLLKDLPDIPRIKKNEKLSEATVRWICSQLQGGVSPMGILKKSTNNSIKLDNIYDIKRRKNFKHIVCDYKW